MPVKIGIIGGGAGGVAVCQKLYLHIRETVGNNNHGDMAVEVTVFEKDATIGPGFAYASHCNCHVIHHPDELMKDYYKFDLSKENNDLQKSYKQKDYTPRHSYGAFLSSIAEETQKQAAKLGMAIDYRCHTEVFDVVTLDENNIQIKTSTGDYSVNIVVFCTGHLPSKKFRDFIGKKGYWHDPYCSKEEMSEFDFKSDVVILGSRLTAIDAALRLYLEENFQGNALMISHKGLLPVICPNDYSEYQLKYLTVEMANKQPSLENLLSLFWKEVSEAQGVDLHFNTVYKSYKEINALDWLNQQIEETETQPKPWQKVLYAIYDLLPKIYPLMSSEDQETFRKKHFSLLTTYGAGIPVKSAKELRDLIQQGRLSVRGGLKSISTNEANEFVIECEDGETIVTKQLINGTGAGFDVSQLPLYRKMIERGDIIAHPMGGLFVNPNTFRIMNKNCEENARMYAIGTPTDGVILDTADITTVVWQADIVAEIIADSIV